MTLIKNSLAAKLISEIWFIELFRQSIYFYK